MGLVITSGHAAPTTSSLARPLDRANGSCGLPDHKTPDRMPLHEVADRLPITHHSLHRSSIPIIRAIAMVAAYEDVAGLLGALLTPYHSIESVEVEFVVACMQALRRRRVGCIIASINR